MRISFTNLFIQDVEEQDALQKLEHQKAAGYLAPLHQGRGFG
jgi:hypothetical protein